jgi:hypothetical protein
MYTCVDGVDEFWKKQSRPSPGIATKESKRKGMKKERGNCRYDVEYLDQTTATAQSKRTVPTKTLLPGHFLASECAVKTTSTRAHTGS